MQLCLYNDPISNLGQMSICAKNIYLDHRYTFFNIIIRTNKILVLLNIFIFNTFVYYITIQKEIRLNC